MQTENMISLLVNAFYFHDLSAPCSFGGHKKLQTLEV